MSDNETRHGTWTVIGREVISKKGAVMEVTRITLSPEGNALLRSNSRGINTGISSGAKDEVRRIEEKQTTHA